jgi:hypothetical protein
MKTLTEHRRKCTPLTSSFCNGLQEPRLEKDELEVTIEDEPWCFRPHTVLC